MMEYDMRATNFSWRTIGERERLFFLLLLFFYEYYIRNSFPEKEPRNTCTACVFPHRRRKKKKPKETGCEATGTRRGH